MKKGMVAGALLLLLLGACARAETPVSSEDESAARGGGPKKEPVTQAAKPVVKKERPRVKKVDPRKGGFEITLGEWAVTPEAKAIRPGRVTFLVKNQGTMAHGFEIELEGDSSGHGSGDLFKAEGELLQPGESTRLTVDLTMTGVYKIECLVDGHDDMGMEGPLEVSENAPLQKVKTAPATSNSVAIAGFAFDPPKLEVEAGTEVTWTNDDPTPHTVTGEGDFGSDTLDSGDSYSFRFAEAGTYGYKCAIHPEMQGTVTVR